jgi:parallel beta-helix repeat protein
MNRDTNCVNNSIVDSVNQGIFVGCPAYGNNLNGNRIYNAVSSGIKVQNQLEHTPLLTDQRAFNNNFNENVIYLCGNTGIEVTGDINHEPKGNNFVGNTIFKPDNHGIYIQDAHFNNFNNNTIYQPRSDTGTYARGSGFYLVQNVENNNMNDNVIIDERANQLHTAIANREGTDCPNNSVIGNRIIASNSERTVWVQSNGWIISNNYVNGGYYAGIYLDGADNCNVTGNICENNTNETNNAYYEIWLNNTANNNIISNNTCISSAANVANADITVSSGTGNKIENNIGIGTTTEYATILSGLQDMGTGTGIVVQSGNTSFAKRTITGTSNQITVTNGDGISGNPTLSVPTDFYVGAGQVGRDVNNLIDFSTNNQISFKTNNTSSQFVIDSNGNIGINTNDIEAWDSAYVAIQFHSAAIAAGSASNDLCLVNNAYNDGAMKFRSNGYAQKISLENDGSINFQISKKNGTANNTIT